MNKQYAIVVDDVGMALLTALMKPGSVQFLELQGLNLNAENKYNILVTPVLPPVNPATFEPAPQPPVDQEPAPSPTMDEAPNA